LGLSRLIRRSGLRDSVSTQLLCILLFIAHYEKTGEGGIRTLGSTTRLWNNESTYANGREKTSLNITGCYAF
jgi:hypothetical protein